MAVTPYDGCMTGSDLSEWRNWDVQFWDHWEQTYQVGGSYTGGNFEEAQATIAATSALAEWVGKNPPTVSNMHQYDVMLRLVRTWRDWVSALWTANNAGEYDTYKKAADSFDTLYPRYQTLYETVIQQGKIMDQCPPAVAGANPAG
jgi:hypothetical protein